MIDLQFFESPWYSKLEPNGKLELSAVLLAAMNDENFDFEWLTVDADGTFGLPACFGTGRAKMLYQEMYRAVFDHWGEELEKAGLKLTHPRVLNIPDL
ncbi:hypothetical protein [Achromobacter piechaudii]|uniref:hypothetical protein n=1 Tax=Achromobacter piechaudii TaxID=72556 RepID=UPI003DA9D001